MLLLRGETTQGHILAVHAAARTWHAIYKAIAVLMHSSRQISGAGRPPSTRFKAAMIRLLVNLDFFT
jgi:hypothetical protein